MTTTPSGSARDRATEVGAQALAHHVNDRQPDDGAYDLASVVVDALLTHPDVLRALAGDTAPAEPDDEPDEQWCAFSGDPDDGAVVITDDLAVAEETAPLLVDGGIAYRTVTTSAWVIFPRCAGCGSVLDGELCCEARRADLAGAGAPEVDR